MTNVEIQKTVDAVREFKRLKEEAEVEISRLESELKAYMESEGVDELHGGDYKVSWKERVRSGLDAAALKRDLPEIAAQYAKETKYRAFLVA